MQANYGAASSSKISKDPEEARLLKPGNSVYLTAGLMIADVVGAGVLAMGQAVANLGWMLAIPIILLMLAMNAHIMILFWRVRKLHPGAQSYRDLACMTMERAQPEFKDLAQQVVVFGQYSFLFGTLSVYTLSIGQGLGMFFYDMYVCLPLMTFIGCMLLLPLNLSARFLGSFAGSVAFNCICTLGTVLIPIFWMMSQGVDATRPPHSEFAAVSSQLSLSSLVTSACTFSFAFSGQFVLVEIMSEMDDIEEFPKAFLAYSLPFQAAAFFVVGLSVYYFRGNAAAPMIVEEIPFGFVERLAASCLVGHMLITYVIKSVVLSKGLLEEFEKSRIITTGDTWFSWYCMVLLIVSFSWFLAQIVPFFADLVSLLGATLTPLIAFIIPLLLYCLCVQTNEVPASRLELCTIAVELLVSLVVMIYGTASTLTTIFQKWDEYGYPFACHCQYLWRNCECSPHRMQCPATF